MGSMEKIRLWTPFFFLRNHPLSTSQLSSTTRRYLVILRRILVQSHHAPKISLVLGCVQQMLHNFLCQLSFSDHPVSPTWKPLNGHGGLPMNNAILYSSAAKIESIEEVESLTHNPILMICRLNKLEVCVIEKSLLWFDKAIAGELWEQKFVRR